MEGKPIMKLSKTLFNNIILNILLVPLIFSQEMDETLKLLEPFTNKIWLSEMQGLRGEGTISSQKEWEVVWQGKAIKYTSQTEKLNVYTDGYLYWDFDKQEIAVFTLNNKGKFIQGHIIEEAGKLLMYGYITLPDRKLEFRNTFEFLDDGKILDTWYRFEDGEWKTGHSVELFEK